MHVFYTVCIVTHHLGDLRLQPHLHRRFGLHRRLLQGVPCRRDHRFQGGDLLGRRQRLRIRLHLLPDDVRDDHAGADRRRVRGAHEIRRGRAVHPALGDLRLFPDRAHGLVLGRPGRDRRRRQGARRCDRRRRQAKSRRKRSTTSWPTPARSSSGARSTLPAARSCTSMPASPAWSPPSWSASAPATARN